MIETDQMFHELAMLYLKSQDLSGKTPAEIFEMYKDAIHELMNKSAEGWC